MTLHKSIYVAITSFLVVVFMLLTTDPRKLPVVALVIPPVLLVVTFGLLIYRLISAHTPLRSTTTGTRMAYSLFGASLPITLMVLKSIDQLTVKDLLLTGGLVLLLTFYSSRFKLYRRVDN